METERFESFSREDTYEFAKRLAEKAAAGDVYCLSGDLGVGKTVFAQGFGAGLGIDEPMSSPTFTILQEYHEGSLPLYHYDVYRVGDIDEMAIYYLKDFDNRNLITGWQKMGNSSVTIRTW